MLPVPADAKLSWLGFAFASTISSFRSFAGTLELTTISDDEVKTRATPVSVAAASRLVLPNAGATAMVVV